jgi:hypothetical protein
MKNLLLISIIILGIFTSCNDIRVKKLQAENKELKDRNDTLLTWLAKERVAKSIEEYRNTPVKGKTIESSGMTSKDFASKAFTISQDFVKRNLKSPKSADFPLLDYSWSDLDEMDNIIIIKSYVDAQNAYGADIRQTYYTKLQFIGGDWSDINNWKLIDLQFTD